MNTGNFQNMAAMRGPTPGGQQQAGQQRGGGQAQVQHIFKTLQQQQHPPGWQTTVTVHQRTQNVIQLISSLRLIKQDMDIDQVISVAITFESKIFRDCADKTSYEQQCRDKLGHIRDTRSRQTANLQQQMQTLQPPQMSMMSQQMPVQATMSNQNQPQFQTGYPNPQLQHPMQASPVPHQQQPSQTPQQLSMSYGMPNAQMPMQQQQMSQTMYQPVGHMSQADTSFTPEEKEQINRRAQKLAQSTPRTALDKIRNNLQNMSPEQRQHLMNQNVDPLAYFFHDAATKQFIAAKANIQAQGHLRQGGMPPTGAPMPQQTRPMSQNSLAMQGQQAAAVAVPQGFEPSFLGNMNQILGQQQDALRSQEAGHLVVPASDSQKLAQAQQQRTSYHGTPQQKMDGQVAMPRPMSKSKTLNQPQQQFFDTQQLPQGKAQHAVQLQTQAHAQAQLQARMNAQSHAQQLQGQVGGLGNHLGPRPAQQPSPAMSMLNRPLNQQSQLQGTSQQRPQQQTPNMGQMKSQEQAMVQQPSQQAPQQNLPQGPQQNRSMAAIHQQLANLPEDRRRVLVAQWQHQRQQQQQQQLQLQQQQQQRAQPMQMNGMQGIPSNAVPMQNQQSQSGQIPPQALPPGQVKTNQPASVSSVNALQRPPSAQRQPQAANIKQQLGQQHRDQAQQQEMMRRQNMQQRRAAELTATSLTEDQAREMDKVNFPAGILNANNALSQLPANVSTWGQLISWVAQNAHSLPAESLGKLRGLQGLHYQNISNNQQRNMAQQMSHGPPGAQQNIPMNAALQAQSITSRNTQPLMQATNIPQMVGPSGATSLPPPTTQEIQAVRARLPEQGKTATDDQVRAMILRRRQMDMVRAGEGQQVMTQQQAQYMAMQRAQQQQSQQQQLQRQMVQTPSAQLAPPPQLQPPQQPPVSRVPAGQNNEKTPRLAQQSRQALQAQSQGQTVQKGVKRSNDDVVEVPNPNLTQQKQSQAQQQHQPQTSANPQNLNQHRLNVPQISAQQMSSMPRQQRAQFEEMKRQAAQRAQATPQQQPINGTKPESQVTNEHQRNEENMRKDARLKQIVQEVLTSTPKRAPLPLNPQIMATMAQQLRDAKEMVTRMEQSLPMFFRMFGDENTTRELIRTRLLLVQQYRDKEYNPGDHFTISPEELEASIIKLRKYFSFAMQRMVQQRNSMVQAQGNQQPVQDRQTQASQVSQGQTPELNAANLQQHQQTLQAAAQLKIQRIESHRQNRAPAAPTAAQPPFLLGAQSPDGTPHAYGPTVLTQDQLKFPPPKKRKPNQQGSAASTPAQVQATPASSSPPQMVKIPSPEAQRHQAVSQTFKCPHGNCDASKNGFSSPAELAKHTADMHELKEPPIDDPLAWAMESVRLGLGLDAHGKMKPRKEEAKAENKALEAPKMKLSASQQSQTPMKQEVVTPAGQTALPMSRAPTQTGPSPASQMLKTPQPSIHVKTPASATSAVKLDPSKESKAKSPSAAAVTKSSPTPPPFDPWADSSISPASLSRCFSGLSDLQSIPWSELQCVLTPPSSSSLSTASSSGGGGAAKSTKNSPRASDIGEGDVLDIKISSGEIDRSWLPDGWFEDPGVRGRAGYGGRDLCDVDWETEFGKMGVKEEGWSG